MANGPEVVEAALAKVRNAGLGGDKGFLKRIAWVESKFGMDRNTYKSGYYGGIWQVDDVGFQTTQNEQHLNRQYQKMKQNLGIDWQSVRWHQLVDPLYSALAARLYLYNIETKEAIPGDLQGQARYWKVHYNTWAGSGTEQKFITDVQALESGNWDPNWYK